MAHTTERTGLFSFLHDYIYIREFFKSGAQVAGVIGKPYGLRVNNFLQTSIAAKRCEIYEKFSI